jgi:hypothetical protein
LESVKGEDWLGFAGIPAVVVPALSVEQHWAEKFHAYTRPRETPNSRVYAAWKQYREAAFAACSSHDLDNAVTAGAGRVEALELGHRYGHLSPLVAVA